MQTLPADRQKTLVSPAGSTRASRRALAAAFASFNQTAGSLETTYSKLHAEVARLRHELEDKNRSLERSLEENRRVRAHLARILEGLPCGVMVFDGGLNLRMMNPAAGHLLNPHDESASLPEASIPQSLGSLLAALPHDDFSHEQEWVVDGAQSERTLGVTRAWLQTRESGGDSILILRDLTEAKQLEREREVSRRSQALAEVATLLAHEVRNPLGSLELFAGLLADALADRTELQGWINHVQAGLRSLAATVNNVLQFHTQPCAQLLPIDLRRLVNETAEFLRPLAQQKEMRVVLQTPGESISILGDPSRLQQAFLNLALNSFRAMQPGGALSVSVIPKQENAEPTVDVIFADQGTGIRPENLEKIFEPGFTTQSSSPGLGLAVTRKVIEQHGGTIRVESQEGRGTTFTLTLRLATFAGDPVIRRLRE
jgi:signal transduction histidine kinase